MINEKSKQAMLEPLKRQLTQQIQENNVLKEKVIRLKKS
jgi:hypothetical protein